MQLSPLQSRLAASAAASLFLLVFYFLLFPPRFASAAELDGLPPRGGIHDTSEWNLGLREETEVFEPSDLTYEADFPLFDRSIIGRAPAGVTALGNNAAVNMNLEPGTTQNFVFEATLSARSSTGELQRSANESLVNEPYEGPQNTDIDPNGKEIKLQHRQQATRTLYVSANTCLQPQSAEPDKTTMDPPQLSLYVSTSTDNQKPGPMGNMQTQTIHLFDEGAVMLEVPASGDVFLGVSAPMISSTFTGGYNVEIAASIDTWFHTFDNKTRPDLIWVDSDSKATLLITQPLTNSTDEIMAGPPYVMFGQNQGDRSIRGVRNSLCGLKNYAQIAGTKDGKFSSMITTGLTNRGVTKLPQQEFYFSGLNSSSAYMGILAREGNKAGKRDNVPGGGGTVWRATNFTTKDAAGTCEIVFNLTFCDQTAYAVPGNPAKFANATALASFYDDYARSMYDNFLRVIQQIPCEAPSTQQYSLARTCDDCKAAYKDWLCMVSIPRCEEFSKEDSFLQPRRINETFSNGSTIPQEVIAGYGPKAALNSYLLSRNPVIDEKVSPGPYKEVLPCDSLCYNLVQSCPASMGLGCPQPGMYGFEESYGRNATDFEEREGIITCNYPGSAHIFSASSTLTTSWSVLCAMLGLSLGLVIST